MRCAYRATYNKPHICFFQIPQSRVQLFAAPWTAACQASLSFTITWRLIKLEPVMPSNNLILCLLLPSMFPSTAVQSVNSLVLILLYGPTLISIHDY